MTQIEVPETTIRPIEYNVLIYPDPVEQKTKGGIIISDVTKESDEHAQQRGTIVAMSPFAFTYDNWPMDANPPVIGDRVFFARYDGALIDDGGHKFRLVKDKSIAAVIS